jgi:O-antigen/teichoic acid export membrane protein
MVSSVVGFLLISNILLPVFSQLNGKRAVKAFEKVFKYTVMLTIPAFFGFLVLGRYFVVFLYGKEYFSATLPLVFLSLLIFELPLSASLVSLILSRGKSKITAKFMVIATILNIILNYVLISTLMKVSLTWAIGGAAIATVTSRFFYTGALLVYSHKKLRIKTPLFKTIKPLFAAIVMAVILLAINTKINDMTLLLGAGEVLVGTIVYFFVLNLLGGIDKEELKILFRKDGKHKKKDR